MISLAGGGGGDGRDDFIIMRTLVHAANSIKSSSAVAATARAGFAAGEGLVQSWAKVPLKPMQPRW